MKTPKSVVARLLGRTLAPLTRPWFSGMGSIVMMHRIVDPPPYRRIGWPHRLELTPDTLSALVALCRRRGYEFISLDALHERLCAGVNTRRCAVLTFDDGYADVYTRAYPFLNQEGIPFTVYVTTGFIDGTFVPWWYVAEGQIAEASQERLSSMQGSPATGTFPQQQREQVFAWMTAQLRGMDPHQLRPAADRLLGTDEIDRACAELPLSWSQIAELARDPLVTIGAHTVNHRSLRSLPELDARWEMEESRRRLEAKLQRKVDHFAYPHGTSEHAGPREFALARACGFKTAVTTRMANVFPGHVGHLEALPRLHGATVKLFDRQMSGAPTVLRYRKGLVVDN